MKINRGKEISQHYPRLFSSSAGTSSCLLIPLTMACELRPIQLAELLYREVWPCWFKQKPDTSLPLGLLGEQRSSWCRAKMCLSHLRATRCSERNEATLNCSAWVVPKGGTGFAPCPWCLQGEWATSRRKSHIQQFRASQLWSPWATGEKERQKIMQLFLECNYYH